MRLRVATLNVWNYDGDPRRPELINRELRRLDPDLIALQEVVQTPERSQLDALLAGMPHQRTHQNDAMATVPPWVDRYGGSAVASRWPHRVVEVLDSRLPDAADVPWATLAILLTLPQDQGELLFIGAMTAWRLSAVAAREREVVAITDLDARQRQALPTIIAGDFNDAPEAASIRYMTGLQSLGGRGVYYHDAWAIAGDGPGYTWTVDNPNTALGVDQIVKQPNHRRRIDYVFIGGWDAHPRAHCRVEAASLAFNQPIDGIWLSDHYGLVVDLELGSDT